MPMLLQIHGYHLPGRERRSPDEHYDNVHVGVQVGKEPHELAVQGRPGARFIYLTWGDVAEDGSFAMFRRAKLMLADLESLITSDRDGTIVATVDLTDDCGGPRCARLRAPALRFT